MEDNKKTIVKNIEETGALEEKTVADVTANTLYVLENDDTISESTVGASNEPSIEKADDEATVAETAEIAVDEDAAVALEDLEKTELDEKAEEPVANDEETKTDSEAPKAGAEAKAEGEKEEPAKDTKGEDQKQYGLPADHPEMGELRDRIDKRKKEKKKKQRRFRTWVYVTAFSLMAIIFGFFFSISGFFTVDSIEVEGNEHYTSEEIINIAHAVPGRNLLYNTNESEIVAYLEQNPYIKSAEVRRKLPSTLLIVVKERSERMAFKYDNDYLVMDGEGVLLRKTRNEPQTTLVEGLIVNKIKLGEKIGTEDRDKANKVIDLISAMTSGDLFFVRLDMNNTKRVKAYIYDNLIVRADYNTLMTNIKNGHLHQVVEKLLKDGIKRGTITFEEDGSASFMPII